MKKRALVLGGGGPVGIGWEVGLLAGLAETGVNFHDADLIVGTSAGAFVGAQIALGASLTDLAEIFKLESNAPMAPAPDASTFHYKMIEAGSGERPAQQVYVEIGAYSRRRRKTSST